MNNLEQFMDDVKEMAKGRGITCAILFISEDDPSIMPTISLPQGTPHPTWIDVYNWIMDADRKGRSADKVLFQLSPNGEYPKYVVSVTEPDMIKSRARTFTFFQKVDRSETEARIIGEVSFKDDGTGDPSIFYINTFRDTEDVKIPIINRDHSASFPVYTKIGDDWIYNNASDRFRQLIRFLMSVGYHMK